MYKAGWIRDDMVTIQPNGIFVDDVSSDSGGTDPSLPVENKGGLRYECFVAPRAGTYEILGFVNG